MPEFQDTATLEVPFGGVAESGKHGVGERPAQDSRSYLLACASGITEEASGRYIAHSNGELGRGAIGRVFVAEDSHLGRRVAIKELLEGTGEVGERMKS